MDLDLMEAIKDIMYHIGVLNDDYTQLAVDVGVLKSQVSEISWLIKTIVGALLVTLITQFYQIFKINKNNKKR